MNKMTQFTINMKICATCAYWSGTRETDYFGKQYVQVENATQKGKCINPNVGWRGQQRDANVFCTSWEKWPVIK